VNSRTRESVRSSTKRCPWLSKPIPRGFVRLTGRVPVEGEVKFGAPITRLAASPLENGAVNCSTRPFPASTSHKFPEASNVIPQGWLIPAAPAPCAVVLKSGWPNTVIGDSPALNGGANSRTRLCPVSATQRLPFASNATFVGVQSEEAVNKPQVPDVEP